MGHKFLLATTSLHRTLTCKWSLGLPWLREAAKKSFFSGQSTKRGGVKGFSTKEKKYFFYVILAYLFIFCSRFFISKRRGGAKGLSGLSTKVLTLILKVLVKNSPVTFSSFFTLLVHHSSKKECLVGLEFYKIIILFYFHTFQIVKSYKYPSPKKEKKIFSPMDVFPYTLWNKVSSAFWTWQSYTIKRKWKENSILLASYRNNWTK